MSCLSDIHAHNSFIKCMQVWQNHSYLLTAADRTFMIWDLISLTNVFTVKYHKEEIRAVQVTSCGNYMICAGKGSQNQGAMSVWDIRSQKDPVAEAERNEDIFSLEKQGNYIFMGTRSQAIIPFDTVSMQSLGRVENAQGDVITSLKTMDDKLVSGSRDRSLVVREPNLDQKSPTIEGAHQDWVNTLESDFEGNYLYSGGKEGVVKIWKNQNDSLACKSVFACNSSVNSICRLDQQFGKMFVCGTSDKQIKMFKMKDKYAQEEEA